MNRTEMISYVEKKGYKVNYGNYCFNSCVPYFVVNDITIFIAKNFLRIICFIRSCWR